MARKLCKSVKTCWSYLINSVAAIFVCNNGNRTELSIFRITEGIEVAHDIGNNAELSASRHSAHGRTFVGDLTNTAHVNNTYTSLGTTVFRGKFCQIPRRHLPNSAAHRGKFLEFRGSPRPLTLESLCRLWPSYKFIIINSSTARIHWCKICNKIRINFSLFFVKTVILMSNYRSSTKVQ